MILKSIVFVFIFLSLSVVSAEGKGRKKKQATKEVKTESAYQRFFKGKSCETKRGLITLHKMDGKIYFELPLNLLGKEMLLGSTISEITNNDFGSVGEKPKEPLHVVFTRQDSIISLREVSAIYYTTEEGIRKRLEESFKPAIILNLPVKVYSEDSTAVVLDLTDFLLSDNEGLSPFSQFAPINSGRRRVDKEFVKKNSFIGEIKAFEDNFSIRSSLSYLVTVRNQERVLFQKVPFTAVMTRSFILLPEEPMRPRMADPRIAIFYQAKYEFNSKKSGVDFRYYANRWRLEPVDEAAYRAGQLTDVKKPIVFYVDNAFPESWKKYIKQGVEEWQKAFEKIGLKNAIIAKDFPENDPEFDPENLKYSCVRYSPSWTPNAMGPSWTDPRTGEIINASVYFYHNIAQLIQNWRFVQTAQADADVRRMQLPEELLGESIRYAIAHEVGHCLGFMHNMSASAAIPTDSLRSPSYTQKYGTTHSIMDYARNNYVAQPGDKERGVKLTPPHLGLYDYFTIKWLYTPLLDEKTTDEEVPVLDRWIGEKAGDPVYRYGRQQINSRWDPSSFEEDLGDDPMKSSAYGIKNLKYILANLNEWVGAEDKDYAFRQQIYNEIVMQYFRYLNNVIFNIGGIYLNEKYAGDPIPAYALVPKARQKEALVFLLDQLKEMAWIDAKDFKDGLPLMSDISGDMENAIFRGLLSRLNALAVCMEQSKEEAYSTREYMNDLYEFIMAPTKKRNSLSEIEKRLQIKYLSFLVSTSGVEVKGMGGSPFAFSRDGMIEVMDYVQENSRNIYGDLPNEYLGMFARRGCCFAPEEISGFGRTTNLNRPNVSIGTDCFLMLKKTLALLKSRMNTATEDTRLHYQLLVYKLEKVFKNN
ncbi:zinc-dependent metalloprotease [Butyricimonas sp.]|uniref:zinc-dependent metalloprotease n=1 Tax=Butyricimonas sp. TaxID=1969738 RepID=UPI0025C3F01B|nr:zinc-dependent metalloprotease [Butyricimonas sp.]